MSLLFRFDVYSFCVPVEAKLTLCYIHAHTYTLIHIASVTRIETIGISVILLLETSFTDGSSKAFDHAKLCGSMRSMYRILSSCRKIASEKAE